MSNKSTIAAWISIIAIICAFDSYYDTSFAQSRIPSRRASSLVDRAQEQFAKKRYRKAIAIYRRYLRKNRRDADVWTQLAVCYLYVGQPQKSLNLLRRWHSRTNLKAYNEYHQGLSYLTTGNQEKAKIALTRAARFSDEFSSRATYELIVIEYNARNTMRAQYWVNLYKQRYPRGGYITEVLRIDQSLRNNSFIEGLKGNPKPDQEDGLFKYHRLSLYPKPHYYHVQLGYDYTFGTQTDPTSNADQPIQESPLSEHVLKIYSGIGIGPIERSGATSWVGYNYKQDWFTDDSRYQTWTENGPVENYLIYFPFRADLLERTHELYGEVRYPFGKNFFAGVYGKQDFKFIGSSLIPGVDQLEIEQKRAEISSSTLLIPSFGANYLDNFQTLVYFYLRKEISEEAPEFSNQTYNLFGRGDPFASYGISHRMSFPEYQVNVAGELFQYEFLFNDYWLDFTRTGFLAGVEYQFESGFWATAAFGLYTDEYKIPVLRQKSCNIVEKAGTTSEEPESCTRTDDGTIIQAGLYWDYSRFQRISVQFKQVENRSPALKVYERTEQTFMVMGTFAFPSTRRVLRFIDRFGDVVFTKDPE